MKAALLMAALAVAPAAHAGAAHYEEVALTVVDRTLTNTGHDFFRQFAAEAAASDYQPPGTITIRERPSAAQGSIITVEYDGRVLYKGIHQYARRNADDAVGKVFASVVGQIQQIELTRKLFVDPDLGKGDL